MKQVELYNHNKTTYENITRIFKTSNKCATVQPTGSGKSFLIFKLAQDNSNKTIVVFEPNKQIIGRVSEQMKEYDIDNIKFYTYQKLNSQHKRDEISIDNADYICLDELHRIKAKQWEQAVIAIQEKFPNAKVLGLTATPDRMDGQNIIDYFGAELACNITLGDAIVNKILPCPTYISALYTFDEEIQRVYDKINESRNSDEEKDDMRAELEVARKQLENALGVPAILKKHIPDNNGKYLVFCQNVEHLNTMRPTIDDWFTQAGFDVHMYAVHTKNPNHKTEYNEFKADNSNCVKLCLCVDMFNEGVHLEGISGVILFRPTQSNIIYFQQIGRAISASDKNIPIIFDLVNNGNSLGGGSLRTEIETAIDRKRIGISNIDGECGNEVIDIGDFYIYDYVKNSLDVLSGIENKCVDDFDFRLKQLDEYKAKWGHCCVMAKEAEEWEGLNGWANNQRTKKNRNLLSQNRIDTLSQYGFVWNLERWNFDIIINHIKQYLDNGNKLPIPTKYVCEDGFTLGTHIKTFRIQKSKNKIRSDFEFELLKLGVDLNIVTIDNRWYNYFNATKEYLHVSKKPINAKTEYNGYRIGTWIIQNKIKYKKGQLSKDKEMYLKEIYDIESSRNDKWNDKWDDNYELLKEYISIGGKVDTTFVYKDIKLGCWYGHQFTLYNKGDLSTDKSDKLKTLGLLKSKRESSWNDFVIILKSYLRDNIKINSHTVYKNKMLGRKLLSYKHKYKQGKFPEERYQQLLSLGIDLGKEGSLM